MHLFNFTDSVVKWRQWLFYARKKHASAKQLANLMTKGYWKSKRLDSTSVEKRSCAPGPSSKMQHQGSATLCDIVIWVFSYNQTFTASIQFKRVQPTRPSWSQRGSISTNFVRADVSIFLDQSSCTVYVVLSEIKKSLRCDRPRVCPEYTAKAFHPLATVLSGASNTIGMLHFDFFD